MDDFNAEIGQATVQNLVGKYGLDTKNNRGIDISNCVSESSTHGKLPEILWRTS